MSTFYQRWRELRGLTQQAFGDRWNPSNYRHAVHTGPYEPDVSGAAERAALRMGIDALEDLANKHIRLDDDKAAEATVEFLQVVSWGEEPE